MPTELKIVKLPPSKKPQALGWSSRNDHHTKFWGAACIYGKTLACLTCGWAAERLCLAPPFSVESEKDKPHPRSTLLPIHVTLCSSPQPWSHRPQSTYHQWDTGTKIPSQGRCKVPSTPRVKAPELTSSGFTARHGRGGVTGVYVLPPKGHTGNSLPSRKMTSPQAQDGAPPQPTDPSPLRDHMQALPARSSCYGHSLLS